MRTLGHSHMCVKLTEPGLVFGELLNAQGNWVPVSMLFMERLLHPDVQHFVRRAIKEKKFKSVADTLQRCLELLVEAGKKRLCSGKMPLDNIGITNENSVVFCDLGDSQLGTHDNLRNSFRSFLDSTNDVLKELGFQH
eukprot:9592625-Karenia_brevis.AAC.1